MRRNKNTIVLLIVGQRIKSCRISKGLEIEDISEMTGLSYNTLNNIEKGEETHFSNIIEISFALGLHLKELFDIPILVKSRFELSPARLEKSRLTARINLYLSEDYFDLPRKSSNVVQRLKEDFKVEIHSKNVSTILSRMAKNNILKITKEGSKNLYSNFKK